MRRHDAEPLRATVAAVFRAAGSEEPEAAAIARRLVDANLAGHDSHGVIRLSRYIQDVRSGGVVPNRHITVVLDTGALTVVDGNNGFGQAIGAEAMDLAIANAKKLGACILVLRHSAHLGRISDWAEMAADAGLAAFHFVNVTGFGAARVAPFGGFDRRLGTNPIAAAVPRAEGGHIILDMSTSVVAEGKIAVAANRAVEVPDGWLIDATGQPTRNPRDLYVEPGGAIMPFGTYKGYGLSLFTDLLAGALTGGGGTTVMHPVKERVENNMLVMLVDPARVGDRAAFDAEVMRIAGHVTASPPAPGGTVKLPGDPERATRADRLANGIPIEDETWRQIIAAGDSVGVRLAP